MKYKYTENDFELLTIEELKKFTVEDVIELEGAFDLESILTIPKINLILRYSNIQLGDTNASIRYNNKFEYLKVLSAGKKESYKIIAFKDKSAAVFEKFDNYLLPTGSVVNLGSKSDVLITGRAYSQTLKNGEEGYTDYLGIPFPYGMTNSDILLFNQEDIQKVLHIGLQNANEISTACLIKKWLDETNVRKIDLEEVKNQL